MALPISDYVTDTKGVLDNSLRILQASEVVPSPQPGALLPLLRCCDARHCVCPPLAVPARRRDVHSRSLSLPPSLPPSLHSPWSTSLPTLAGLTPHSRPWPWYSR